MENGKEMGGDSLMGSLVPFIKQMPLRPWDSYPALVVILSDIYKVEGEGIQLVPGIEKALWRYRINGFLILGIQSNPEVAKGTAQRQEHKKNRNKFDRSFRENPFHAINAVYNHPEAELVEMRNMTLLELPQIGLLVGHEICMAEQRVSIEWQNSIVVGGMDGVGKSLSENAGLRYLSVSEMLAASAAQV